MLEARNRFGGRILSVSDKGDLSPDGFDLGPSWFWPDMHPRMARVVDGLGLRAFPQHTDGDVVIERSRFEAVQRFPTLPQQPPSMRLAGGTGAIVSALVDALPTGWLHLGARVSHVAIRDGGVVLSFRDGGSDSELVARQVILALPPRSQIATANSLKSLVR